WPARYRKRGNTYRRHATEMLFLRHTYLVRKMARVSVWSVGVASIPMIGTLCVTRCGSDLRLVRCAAPLFFWGTPTTRGQPCDRQSMSYQSAIVPRPRGSHVPS